MARPKSEDRRTAILSAATRVLASQGLGAATATIAKEAGVSNGSLFLYFDTKATLLNALYITLKTDLGTTALAGLPSEGEPKEQFLHVWTQWLHWAMKNPEKRRTLALLEISDTITAESHQAVHEIQKGLATVIETSRANGPMRDVPLSFVFTLTSSIAEATIDVLIGDLIEAEAEAYISIAFEAVWRVLAGSAHPTNHTFHS